MGRCEFIVTLISILSSGRYEGYGILIGKNACLPSRRGHVVGRIRNTVENIIPVW